MLFKIRKLCVNLVSRAPWKRFKFTHRNFLYLASDEARLRRSVS